MSFSGAGCLNEFWKTTSRRAAGAGEAAARDGAGQIHVS